MKLRHQKRRVIFKLALCGRVLYKKIKDNLVLSVGFTLNI
jgi:hypothetical protein